MWEWQGSQYSDGSEAVPEDPALYTIEFADDGSAFILANCNTVRATYEENDGSISIVLGPSTKVACPEGSLDQEYLRDLEGAAIAFSDGTGDLLIEVRQRHHALQPGLALLPGRRGLEGRTCPARASR